MGGALRVLFLLLLLANLLFLGWIRWVAPLEVTTQILPAAAGELQPIRLQREPAETTPVAGTGSTATTPVAIAAAACVSVGPFISSERAVAASAALQGLGFTTHAPRAATDEVRVGSWVRVPDLATAEDATNALASLQAAGLTDAYVVAEEGAPGHAVSVGVFADAARAAEVAMTVITAGFKPEISGRTRMLDVFWLDIDREANGGLPALDRLGGGPNGDLPLEMRACPVEPSAAGQG